MATREARKDQVTSPWRETPLVRSANLSKAAGWYVSLTRRPHHHGPRNNSTNSQRSRVFLKLENLQPSGSFKSRGIGHFCARALATSNHPDRVHFYSSSGGNAGLACVHAANVLGRPSTVVVPMSTKPMMIGKIRAAGASEVVQRGESWSEADAHLREVVMKRAEGKGEAAVYVSPFDHEDVWAGHESLVVEAKAQWEGQLGEEGAPDAVVCSVGGGGLLVGIVQGMEKVGWEKSTVLALETDGADSLAKSLELERHVTLPGITSQATSLGAVRVAARAFELARQHSATGRVKSHVLTDADAAMGCWRFADDERTLVELACGINLALCYDGRLSKALGRSVRADDRVIIVVCGGSNVTTAMVEAWRQEYGLLGQRGTTDGNKDRDGLNGMTSEDVASAVDAPDGN